MTDLELLQYVDGYFANHLDNEYWSGLSDDVRGKCVAMALSDVLAEMQCDALDDLNIPMLKAVAEQAVYLKRNYDSLNEGKVATSESVEGISTGYTLLNANAGVSFRAVAFIKQARRYALGRIPRFGRG